MRNILLVALREFWQRVRSRGFLLTAIGTPLILVIVWVGTSFVDADQAPEPAQEILEDDEQTGVVGYVDQANLIRQIPPPLSEDLFRSFPTVAAAEEALQNGQLDTYYVIAPDYRQSGEVRRVSRDLPAGPPETESFNWLLLGNVLPGNALPGEAAPEPDAAAIARIRNPFQSGQLSVVQVGPNGDEASGDNFMLPFLVAMLVMIPLFTSGSYLLQSVAQEKDSRVMEILLVSLRPRDLLAGKLIGLGALTMVQYVVWIVLGAAAAFITGQNVSSLAGMVNLTAGEVLLVVLFALGGYGLYAAIMAGIGALSPDLESSRSWVFVITLPMLLPIYLWVAITSAPHGLLALALSLIPFSAPLAMLMRMATTTVPDWQVMASLALLALAVVGMIWLMSRLFRVHTLLSGESFSPRRFWTALREA